jgi:hypothetical protein
MGEQHNDGVVLAAGVMLLPFYGQAYVQNNVLCLGAAINAVRDTQRLDGPTIAREVGLSRYPFWRAA